MKDIHGKAIRDYYQKKGKSPLILHNSYDEPEDMPVEVFFREEHELSTLEHLALIECKGKVLDIGAGAGAHALILQERGIDVSAIENSWGCVEVMQQSGVEKVFYEDYKVHTKKYDTLLLLMNGIGIAGKQNGVSKFLKKCKELLNPDGQIMLDSSDISYLYDEEGAEKPEGYFGEIRYCYEYKGEKGDWFDWLYLDQESLTEEAAKVGMKVEILMTDENDQYLACITAK